MSEDFAPTAALETLRHRAALLSFTRRYFEERGYLEVETPLLSPDIVVDTHLEPFATTFRADPAAASGTELFLQTSPEFSLKRLLAVGIGPVFEVFKAFRNGESGQRHNPEFTLIEWYRPGDTHLDQMAFTEEYVRAFCREAVSLTPNPSPWGEGLGVRGQSKATQPLATASSDKAIEDTRRDGAAGHPLTPRPSPQGEGSELRGIDEPFERLTYDGAFERFAGSRVLSLSVPDLVEIARSHGIAVPEGLSSEPESRDEWLNLLLAELVEPRLGIERPMFLYDYPASQAALAVIRNEKPPVAERFEVYVNGIELCNGYHELLDAGELRRRNREQNAKRAVLGLRTLPEESSLLAAMEHGMPNCSGVALGFDRLLMVALGKRTIGEVRAFLTEGVVEEYKTQNEEWRS